MYISVHKFGTSSQTIEGYKLIKKIVSESEENEKIIIVVSAMKGITDSLLFIINNLNHRYKIEEIIKTNNKFACNLDENIDLTDLILFLYSLVDELYKKNNYQNKINLLSIGEYFTATILNRYLLNCQISSCQLDSELIIESDKPNSSNIYNNGNFKVNDFYFHENFKKNKVIIVPGFSGSDKDGNICLLGRGGSDTSGSIIASKIKAKNYKIWTDVNGLYTSDPRIYSNSKLIRNINYSTAQELAAMGAKVLHPYCIIPCAKENIPIIIKNTFNPDEESTVISNIREDINLLSISSQNDISYFKIHSLNMWNNYGFVNDIFLIFTKFCVDVNIINTSQFTITTTTNDSNLEKLSLVSVVGNNLITNCKINEIFQFVKDKEIIMTSFSSNNKSISFLVKKEKSRVFIQDLHNKLIKLH